ncbi:TadE/TadG family type IV pilus assembly protein [Devosia sp.]|uniref:TadE/TadG family type IV pilus assembly protein n=1 Tax=Devosia sp. TaxID=1871048 RepID=UPI003A9434A8
MTWRRFIGDRAGASAVEFALIAAPLLLLIVGTVEYGRLIWTKQAMQSIAISTARCMGVAQSECSAGGTFSVATTRSMVITEAGKIGVSLEPGDVTLQKAAICNGISGFSQVTISYQFTSAAPEFLTAMATGGNLSATACFPNQS